MALAQSAAMSELGSSTIKSAVGDARAVIAIKQGDLVPDCAREQLRRQVIGGRVMKSDDVGQGSFSRMLLGFGIKNIQQ